MDAQRGKLWPIDSPADDIATVLDDASSPNPNPFFDVVIVVVAVVGGVGVASQ